MTASHTSGIHHVTALCGDAQQNLDFYTGPMGMRLVKKSINQDAPDIYHLFYADGAGTPGTDLTFFPHPGLHPARPGAGQIVEVPLAVPVGSLPYWQQRLAAHGIAPKAEQVRFGEKTLPFSDPHGLRLSLVETDDARPFVPWVHSPVPVEHQVRGLHAVRMWARALEPTTTLLTQVMGFAAAGEEEGWHRYTAGGGSGSFLEIRVAEEHGAGGVGGVHHVAWRVPDEEAAMALRARLERAGRYPTPLIDRFWFNSIYFREPGGVLFELATDGPGFARDEDPDQLGERLILPPWLEAGRRGIEADLPVLTAPARPA